MAEETPRVIPYICCDGASDAIEFYKRAFGAEELYRLENPDGSLGHAEIKIGDSIVEISDEWPEGGIFSPLTLNGNSCTLTLVVEDTDSAFQRAVEAGAKQQRPIKDEPYGRIGWVDDPFGHRWAIIKMAEDWDPEKMKEPTAPA
ncbi:MAG TPA: VOC family protein [Dehalococcoidia bacterium]|nr:VOC family protein [Dehalococcoidia bacterium]